MANTTTAEDVVAAIRAGFDGLKGAPAPSAQSVSKNDGPTDDYATLRADVDALRDLIGAATSATKATIKQSGGIAATVADIAEAITIQQELMAKMVDDIKAMKATLKAAGEPEGDEEGDDEEGDEGEEAKKAATVKTKPVSKAASGQDGEVRKAASPFADLFRTAASASRGITLT